MNTFDVVRELDEQAGEMNDIVVNEMKKVFPHIDKIPLADQKRVIIKTKDFRPASDCFGIDELMELVDLHVREINKQIKAHKGKPLFVVFPRFQMTDFDGTEVCRQIVSSIYFDGGDMVDTVQHIIEKRKRLVIG